MTDNQFYALITVLGAGLAGIGAAIRFSVGRVVSALDQNSAVMLKNTESNAILSTKIDAIAGYVQSRSRVPSAVKELIREEVSAAHEAADVESTDDSTPPEGTRKPRASSVHGPTKRRERP
jgi:hypothetical protein